MTGPPPTPDASPAAPAGLGQRAARGAAALLTRTAAMQLVQLASSLVVARALVPREYGALALGLTLAATARYTGDLGVTAALVQRPAALFREEALRHGLAIQLVLGTGALASVAVVAPFLAQRTDAPATFTPITLVLTATLLIDAWRTAPRVRLQRDLRLGTVAGVEVAETLVLYAVQIGGLLAGLGVWAVALGHVARALTSAGGMMALGGGTPGPRIGRETLALLRSSVSYQATSVAVAVTGLAAPLVVGLALDAELLGLWAWASVLAAPLGSLLLVVHGAGFPAMSRVHDGVRDVVAAARLVLRATAALAGVAGGTLLALTEPVVRIVYDERWLPALTAVRLALVGAVLGGFVLAVGMLYEASGSPGRRARAAVGGGVLTLAALPVATRLGGVAGAAAATWVLGRVAELALLRPSRNLGVYAGLARAAVLVALGLAAGWVLEGRVTSVADLILSATATGLALSGVAVALDPRFPSTLWRLVRVPARARLAPSRREAG